MSDDSPAADSNPPPPDPEAAAAPKPAPSWVPSAFWTYAAFVAVAALAMAFGWARVEDAFDARRLFR